MEFKEALVNRYATKKFNGKVVSEEIMTELYGMITLSASSFGLQPYKIVVVKDEKTKALLLPHSYNQPQITTCSHLLVFCAYTDITKRINQYENMMKGAPAEHIKTYIGFMRGFEAGLDDSKKLIWAEKQTYLALGNALNGSKALGLDSCPMEGFLSEEYAKVLRLPKELVPSVLCPIGYAADKGNPKLRYDDLIIEK